MSENRRRPIEAERVIIYADEVIVIEANDRKKRRQNWDNNEVGGESRRNWHRDDGIAGAGNRRNHHDDDVAGESDHRHDDDGDVGGVEDRRRRSWW